MIERPQPFALPARTARRRTAMAALLALALAACGPAADQENTLDNTQLRTVIGELDALAHRPDRAADGLVPRVATPDRIDRLFRMPVLAQQRFEIRRQALALAGRGTTLAFERPADVLARMAEWFPERFGTPHARRGRLDSAGNRLYGPYPEWNAEATAFMVLWECMPAIAWEEPDANPFRQRPGDTSFAPLAATSSSQREFRDCVFQMSGEADHFDKRLPRDAAEARAAALGAVAAPVLQQKFDTYLHAHGCSGRGPEDCVLLLWMWSSLAPDDPRLAETLRWLEPAVRPTGEPPPLSKPDEEYGAEVQETNEPRFDEAIRKAAFLRAKLNAVLRGPANWPPDARAAAFQQLAQLQAWFDANVDPRWQPLYALERRHAVLDPWRTLGKGGTDEAALLDELDALPADTDCATKQVWFRHGGPLLQAGYALRQLRRGGALPCGDPGWAWLAQGEQPGSAELRGQFIAALASPINGAAYEAILDRLLGGCPPGAIAAWAQPACAAWISLPMSVSATTRRQLLHHAAVRDWPGIAVAPPPPLPTEITAEAHAAQTEWLRQAAAPFGPTAGEQAARLAGEFEQRGALVQRASGWRAPGGGPGLLELVLWPPRPASTGGVALQGTHVLLLFEGAALRLIDVPARFSPPQDDGRVAAVTDLDGDGRPELWLSGSTGECDVDKPRPGIDCSVETLQLGEVRGELLSYFKDDRPPPAPAKPAARR